MLLRVVVQNFRSFGDAAEFNMLPSSRQTKHQHHIYEFEDFKFLKMSSIYGANGAGKSNLSRALHAIKRFIETGKLGSYLYHNTNKFVESSQPQAFIVEIIHEAIPFLYGFEILGREIISEELYISSLGKGENRILLKRYTEDGVTKLQLHEGFNDVEENRALLNILEKSLIKKDTSALKTLIDLENQDFKYIELFISYFKDFLVIIDPDSKPTLLALKLESEDLFKDYVIRMMDSFGVGIKNISTEKISPIDFTDILDINSIDPIKEIIADFKEDGDNGVIKLGIGPNFEEFLLDKEDGEVIVKRLIFQHECIGENDRNFYLSEESDGTIRLLDYMPLFHDIVQASKVYFVDEIERSIHPLLIKQLIKKFADDPETEGQLIFTTHETNILDQDILRTDEIWFIEKDRKGNSQMYPLSDFKEHHSKNIQKGYMNGRYGAIPFLGNLQDLNWHSHVVVE